jgi:hypothetical protein
VWVFFARFSSTWRSYRPAKERLFYDPAPIFSPLSNQTD